MRLGVEASFVEGALVRGDVEVADGRIIAVGLGPAGRGLAIPGLVDLQVNGFAGVHFLNADAKGYRDAARALAGTGVTTFLPTLTTAPKDVLIAALGEATSALDAPGIAGVHVEGPFISAARLGVHPAESRLDPDLALLKRLLVAGPVRLVTLAPELPRAHEVIAGLLDRDIAVSLGHSDATAEEANAAFDLGVRTVTHVFNAMRPFAHRDPGLAAAALVRHDVTVELILDGHHVADDAARLAFRAARGRVVLVTDAMAAAGAGDGRWRMGRVDVEVRGGVVRRLDGVLAGSVLCLRDAVARLVGLGATLEEALHAASGVPARVAGRPELGTLAPGTPADVVVLDDGLAIARVLVDGADAR